MNLSQIIHINSIALNVKVGSKEELLNKMIELAIESGNIIDPSEARKEVFERERIMSTGVGKGIALPHAKTNSVVDSVGALLTLANPIDYDALDGMPVNIVFLLLGRENNVGHHLRLLSKISRLMNDDSFRSKLLNSDSGSKIVDLLIHYEEGNN